MSTPFILHQPYQQGKERPTSVGFLSIQLKDLNNNVLANPIGFALTRLIGNYFEIIEVVEMIALPLERERVINFILNWSERVPFSSCYIDKENYLDYNSDQRWQQIIRTRSRLHRYPFLRPAVRPDDLVFRQKEVLTELLKDGRLRFAKSLNIAANFSDTYKPGERPEVDALAGATEVMQKMQRGLLASVGREQARIKAAGGRSIY